MNKKCCPKSPTNWLMPNCVRDACSSKIKYYCRTWENYTNFEMTFQPEEALHGMYNVYHFQIRHQNTICVMIKAFTLTTMFCNRLWLKLKALYFFSNRNCNIASALWEQRHHMTQASSRKYSVYSWQSICPQRTPGTLMRKKRPSRPGRFPGSQTCLQDTSGSLTLSTARCKQT